MQLIADLHVHSRFSRATSRDLDLPALHRAALLKGVDLVATGDFTHPGWMTEIEQQLVPAEEGWLRLRPELEREVAGSVPAACARPVRFVLQVEISTIYSCEGRVRKNHNLVLVPSVEAARTLSDRLASIGNLASDGRPILGLDARDLLEIVLELGHPAFLVPAHVWTPWFSTLGSKSGFDSLAECFRDLADHVFAAETGLSSDPPMNWRVSSLDGLTLVSNSDAHSPANLGREANRLDIEPGWEGLERALRTGAGLLGTLEFYPEKGKYHLDGHRKCGLRLQPEMTRELGGRCPECGAKITVGVLSRVEDLADRPAGAVPAGAVGFTRLLQLAEVVGQALGVGAGSQRVARRVDRLLTGLGPELQILTRVPCEDIARLAGSLVAEGVRRVRSGELSIAGGYDGEFGSVEVFAPGERERLHGQLSLLCDADEPLAGDPGTARRGPGGRRRRAPAAGQAVHHGRGGFDLDPDQRQAVEAGPQPLLVVAGPGTGKTSTLVARIAGQVASDLVRPEDVLAVTFTNQAAQELAERVRGAVPGATAEVPLVTTFHGLGLRLLEELEGGRPEILGDEELAGVVREVADLGWVGGSAEELRRRISLAKSSLDPRAALTGDPATLEAFDRYCHRLAERGVVDVDDLLRLPLQRLEADAAARRRLARRFRLVCVDEYQDVNDVQAALVERLAPDGAGLTVIGDPHQAIYGFRGARPGHFQRFAARFEGALVVGLSTSYRLTHPIVAVASAVMADSRGLRALRGGPRVEVVQCPTPASEAEQVVVRLEELVGGSSHFALDSGRATGHESQEIGFGDVAVLSRTRSQARAILHALGRSGIPCRAVAEDEAHHPRSQKVAVMTMHAAKGREFEVVFTTGLEEGVVPLDAAGRRGEPEEERRLLYVAVTRARRLAILSHSAHRSLWGQRLPGAPSRFLSDLPAEHIQRRRAVLPRHTQGGSQLDLF